MNHITSRLTWSTQKDIAATTTAPATKRPLFVEYNPDTLGGLDGCIDGSWRGSGDTDRGNDSNGKFSTILLLSQKVITTNLPAPQ